MLLSRIESVKKWGREEIEGGLVQHPQRLLVHCF